MSADNGLLLRHTEAGWEFREYCASYDEKWEKMFSHGVFLTADEALEASKNIYAEYGISFAGHSGS